MFTSPAQCIVNTVNIVGVMGNGIALWEKNYTINVDYLLSSGIRLLLPGTAEADFLKLKISIEGHLVAYIKKSLSQNRIV